MPAQAPVVLDAPDVVAVPDETATLAVVRAAERQRAAARQAERDRRDLAAARRAERDRLDLAAARQAERDRLVLAAARQAEQDRRDLAAARRAERDRRDLAAARRAERFRRQARDESDRVEAMREFLALRTIGSRQRELETWARGLEAVRDTVLAREAKKKAKIVARETKKRRLLANYKPCARDDQCQSNICRDICVTRADIRRSFEGENKRRLEKQRKKTQEFGGCKKDDDCAGALVCRGGICVTNAMFEQHKRVDDVYKQKTD